MSWKKYLALCLIAVMLLSSRGAMVTAASGTAKVYYNSSLSYGTTQYIYNKLNSMGYSARRTNIPTKSSLLSAYQNSKLVHVLSHGSSSGATVCSDGNLTISNITGNLSGLKFAFLETCYSAYSGASMGQKLVNKGASASLGFRSTITASSDVDGVHYYAQRFYYYANNGYTILQSSNKAKVDLYASQGEYCGTNYVTLYGASSSTIN